LPNVLISKSNDIDCTTAQAKLMASGGVKYSWAPAINISNPNVPNPIVYPTVNTFYKATVTASNGCIEKDSILVATNLVSDAHFYIPSAFTPNGDGKNDCFGVKYWANAAEFELSVYNRFGVKIFYSKNLQDCWDGSYNKENQPSGTYVYTIKIKSICGSDYKKGTVVLIR
jgi:gliding motility-associated-like protein